jgi:hypothetical protein
VLAPTGGPEGFASAMYSGKKTAWVQETSTVQPYLSWRLPVVGHTVVEWRDVVILNHRGEFGAVLNLVDTPLTATDTSTNNTAVRNAIIAQANSLNADLDADGLPNLWETDNFGNQTTLGTTIVPGSGRAAFMSYALGLGATERGGPAISEVTVGGRRYFQMEYRRLTGLRGYPSGTTPAQITYTPQVFNSTTNTWNSATWTAVSDVDPYDGKGTRIVTARCPVPNDGSTAARSQFVRLRVSKN